MDSEISGPIPVQVRIRIHAHSNAHRGMQRGLTISGDERDIVVSLFMYKERFVSPGLQSAVQVGHGSAVRKIIFFRGRGGAGQDLEAGSAHVGSLVTNKGRSGTSSRGGVRATSSGLSKKEPFKISKGPTRLLQGRPHLD